MEKPIIELWDSAGFGLIIEHPTGIVISNQTGGTACFHPTIEGIFLPLGNKMLINSNGKVDEFCSPENDFLDYFVNEKYQGDGAIGKLDNQDVLFINSTLKRYHLDFITVDETKLKQSHEAWVFVKILENNESLSVFRHFAKDNAYLTGVITWQNSD